MERGLHRVSYCFWRIARSEGTGGSSLSAVPMDEKMTKKTSARTHSEQISSNTDTAVSRHDVRDECRKESRSRR